MKVRDYKDMRVWQKGVDIVQLVYGYTGNFPANERYTMTSQMRRSAVSIPSNVAEGFVRRYTKEYVQFLYVALGSCAELDTLAVLARNKKYLDEKDMNDLTASLNYEMRMLTKLINHLVNSPEPRITGHKSLKLEGR